MNKNAAADDEDDKVDKDEDYEQKTKKKNLLSLYSLRH